MLLGSLVGLGFPSSHFQLSLQRAAVIRTRAPVDPFKGTPIDAFKKSLNFADCEGRPRPKPPKVGKIMAQYP